MQQVGEKQQIETKKVTVQLHPAEWELIRYLRVLKNGAIKDLWVSDGLPVSAEEVARKENPVASF